MLTCEADGGVSAARHGTWFSVSDFRFDVFPVNGLDRSLHAPVFVGLLALTFFAETFGWTYAGLVVPGYLATVFISAPVTGALILAEAVLTYAIAALLGRWLPKTGAWSTTFGRERFFLFIVGAVVVRLFVEGNLVPWVTARYQVMHSRELYSLGLVLVPLVSNMFWNAGFKVSAPRMLVVTLLTYAVVQYGLLAHTNFTISRFELANESVSLTFIESPHAHIILLVGALLGARNNLLYGWDYNGILVPALLAVAWYEPTKLLTTLVEALLVYKLSQLITSKGPLSRVLIVGSRRMVVAYSVGFAVKYALGLLTLHWDPGVQMVDYFGFGYLLPSLLAVKMWNKGKIGVVLMPTVQVSLLAFVAGNLVGIGFNALDPPLRADPSAETAGHVQARTAPFALLLGETAPDPSWPEPGSRYELAPYAALRVAKQVVDGELSDRAIRDAATAGLTLSRAPGDAAGWVAVTPRSEDPNLDRFAPRLAVRPAGSDTIPFLIIAAADRVGSPVIPVAFRAARRLGARAIVVWSPNPAIRSSDQAFAERALASLNLRAALIVGPATGPSGLSVAGALPTGLDVTGLGESFETDLQVSFRAPLGGASVVNAPRLELSRELLERFGSEELTAPEPLRWPGSLAQELRARLVELTSTEGPAAEPSIEELRLFGAGLIAPLIRSTGPATAWQRALAAQFGYRFVVVGGSDERPEALGLVELGAARRGHPSCFLFEAVRVGPKLPGRLAVEVPAPRWESGTLAAATGLVAGLDAGLLLVAGTAKTPLLEEEEELEDRVRSSYQRVHELWLGAGGTALSVGAIAPTRVIGADAIVSQGVEAVDGTRLPEWTEPVRELLVGSGLRVTDFDGTLATAPFSGMADPALSFAARFAPGQVVRLWLGADVRRRLVRAQEDVATAQRLARASIVPRALDLAERALTLAACSRPGAPEMASDPLCGQARLAVCDLDEQATTIELYARTRNPYDLARGLAPATPCALEVVQDERTSLIWVILAARGEARVVPLLGGPPSRAPRPLHDPAELRRAAAWGLTSLTVL